MSKLMKIKEMLSKMLIDVELGALTTDKGVIYWNGDEELAVGDEVLVEDENGEKVQAEAGEYTTDNRTVIVIEDGKVLSITEYTDEVEEQVEDKEAEAEEVVEAEEETVENPTNEGEETDTEAIVKLREEVNELYSIVDMLKAEIEELKKRPEARPAHEEFEMVKKEKMNDRASRILSHRKK